jgi:type VI secretion system protein ImpL
MKRFFSWLIKPAVLSFIGVLLLSLVIWFEAPLLSFDGKAPFESDNVRWTFILIFFLLWAGYFAWKKISAYRANAKLMKSVAGEDEAAPALPPGTRESAAELAAMAKRMQEAMAILKKSKSGGKGGLYQLPWYMFIGAPGTGKTTALTQSGLKFPLADSMGKGAIGGVGGTRNCDWWFTDEAVLLDTAGRYTTQDSNTDADKAAWGGFLQLLRKHRRRRPINGVIIAVSAADLLQESDAWRAAQAQSIRERLKELHEKLGVRFPVYVMVTKTDLLAGFMEYFDGLGREERAQVWGVTFPLADTAHIDATLAAFPAEFALLEQQLQARVLARMQQERDVQKRALVYSFPQQFAGIGEPLGRFLGDVFQANRYEEESLLRGVYFSSGTQEGSPIDRVMSAMAASFGLDRQVLAPNGASGRSYFITNLLQQVIFPEAELAGVNRGLERKRRYLQWGASAAIGLLLVLGCAGMVTSYLRNQAYVADMAQRSAAITAKVAELPAQGSALALLPVLDSVRDLPGGFADKDKGAPWLNRFGLYQGDKLGEGAQQAYRKLLHQTLLPRIQRRMEDQLRRSDANNTEYLYEVLRVYLMLGDAAHFDAESVAAWVSYDNELNLKDASDDQKQDLSAHVLALLAGYQGADAAPQIDTQLVSDTRLALARMPVQQRVYNRLKRQLMREKLPEFSVVSSGGRDASAVFVRRSGEPLTRGINGMFSVAGYARFLGQADEALADVEKERWVLAQQEAATLAGDGAQVREAVLQLYYADYIAQWDALLADVNVTPFANLEQGARLTNMLSGADSPLRKFMTAAARETTLEGTKGGKSLASVSAAVKGKLDAYKQKLQSALGGAADAPAAPAKAVNPVDAHFDDLHKMTAGTPAPLDGMLAMLKDVAVYLDAAAAAKRSGTPPPAGDALAKLKLEAGGKPAPLGALLKSIDGSGAGLTSGSERERLNSLYTSGVAQFCRQAVAGRYPLVRGSAQDVTPDDFGKFFAPGGLLDDFFQKNLLQYVDMGGASWKWRPTANNGSLGIGQDVLDGFQRGARIRDAFFANGGRQASLRFDLKPVSLDAAITKLTFELDGQVLPIAANGNSMSFQLPSGKGNGQVKLDGLPASAHSSIRTDGPWAFFRMLDKASVEPTAQGERYKITFDLDGRKAGLELTASSVVNPFRRATLEQFRCMDRL